MLSRGVVGIRPAGFHPREILSVCVFYFVWACIILRFCLYGVLTMKVIFHMGFCTCGLLSMWVLVLVAFSFWDFVRDGLYLCELMVYAFLHVGFLSM